MAIPSERSLRVFLCHASNDKTIVHEFYERLIADKVDAWLDKKKLLAGQNWQEEIPKAVKLSDVVIVFLSKDSINKNGYVQKEIKLALETADEKAEGTIFIIPARIDNCIVPERFKNIQWVDLFEPNGYNNLLKSLELRREQLGLSPLGRVGELFNNISTEYRIEILNPMFKFIKSGESFCCIGMPNAGKTRLIDFILGDDQNLLENSGKIDRERVIKKYLGKRVATSVWLMKVDINRMSIDSDWQFSFFELLLHTMLLFCHRHEHTEELTTITRELFNLHVEVIKSKNPLMAQRHFETAVAFMCQKYNFSIVFFLDEFDEFYSNVSQNILNRLRAVRDLNKYKISYGLFLRNLPERLRKPRENEGFYELISRNVLGIGPFSRKDTFFFIEQIEKRREYKISPEIYEWLYQNSGGLPSLTQVLFVLLKENSYAIQQMQRPDWFVKQDIVREEFRRIYIGLLREEQAGLLDIARDNRSNPLINRQLLVKGLIKPLGDQMTFFSPLFGLWLRTEKNLQVPKK